MLSLSTTQNPLVRRTPPTRYPGLIGPPCASPHSSHTSHHTADRRVKAGSSTCRAQRVTGPVRPTSGHSRGGVGGLPSSPHMSKAPRTLLQSPTCSGRADSLHTIHRSTGEGSAGLGLGHLCSGPAHSPKRWKQSGSTHSETNMTMTPEDMGCRRRGRWPLGRHYCWLHLLSYESVTGVWPVMCGCSRERASLCLSLGVNRHLRTRLTQRWAWTYRWATTKTSAGKLYCPGWRLLRSLPSPLLQAPSQSEQHTVLTCPDSLHHQQPHPQSAPQP